MAQVDVVGLFVAGLQADGVPAVQPLEGGDAVLGEQRLALLRVVQVRGQLVPARIDVAPVQAQADTGAALGAVADAGGVDVALGQLQLDVDRHAAVLGLVRVGLDVDAGEVVQPHQRFAQAVQLALVEVAAFLPVHQLVQQALIELVLEEGGGAHVVADAADPAQGDVGGVVRAGDFHAAVGEVGVEVAAVGQAAHDGQLAGFVGGVVEHVADLGREGLQVLLQVAVVAAFAFDGQVAPAHAHRFAQLHPHGDRQAFVVGGFGARRLDGDGGRVVTERLQRLARLGGRFVEQVLQARLAQSLAQRVVEGERGVDVLDHQFVVQALDAHLVDDGRRPGRRRGGKQDDEGGEAGESTHAGRIPGAG